MEDKDLYLIILKDIQDDQKVLAEKIDMLIDKFQTCQLNCVTELGTTKNDIVNIKAKHNTNMKWVIGVATVVNAIASILARMLWR
jgi:pantothenate kinase